MMPMRFRFSHHNDGNVAPYPGKAKHIGTEIQIDMNTGTGCLWQFSLEDAASCLIISEYKLKSERLRVKVRAGDKTQKKHMLFLISDGFF